MQHLKVCFIGIGSIARRHIRNLSAVCRERNIELQIDAFRRGSSSELPENVCNVYTCAEAVPNDYDAVFITNPTEYHLASLRSFHDKGKHFFIEKPVVSLGQIEDAKIFPLREDSVYYVACPLRYNAVIEYIKNNIDTSKILSVRSISSSYLPDWRPGQDYRNTYSAHKDLGGGVSIDLIHEWDYITYILGWPEQVFGLFGKKSKLEIDSEDYAIYIAEYPHHIVELHLDYFGRKTIREVQIFTEEETIMGDIANNRIQFQPDNRIIDFNEERDDYQKREISHFLDMINDNKERENGFIHGIRVLELTQGKQRILSTTLGR